MKPEEWFRWIVYGVVGLVFAGSVIYAVAQTNPYVAAVGFGLVAAIAYGLKKKFRND